MPDLPPPIIRILVADDHPLLRNGIASLIRRQADMQLIAEVSNGVDAVSTCLAHRPDITLMDVRMPRMNGIDATVAIRQEWPGARVVILTTYPGEVIVRRALRAGAKGFLVKSAMRQELVKTIRGVHAGGYGLSREMTSRDADSFGDRELSSRELEVLKLAAEGTANKRIGTVLGVTEDTVKAHMRSVMSKLGATDRTHAVTLAVRRGLIDIDS